LAFSSCFLAATCAFFRASLAYSSAKKTGSLAVKTARAFFFASFTCVCIFLTAVLVFAAVAVLLLDFPAAWDF
jgi:hypothetical protein